MADKMLRAFLVEDDTAWQRIYKFYLEKEGLITEVVGNKEDAFRKMDVSVFDIAVVDLRLNDEDENNWDGINVAKHLRETHPETHLIVKSGFLGSNIQSELEELHADGIFDKGNPIEEFVGLVKKIISLVCTQDNRKA